MSDLLAGKTALVTGAGSGIGRASAIAAAREGARVVLSDINERGLEETATLLGQFGAEYAAKPCDVTSDASVTELVAFAVSKFGRLDCCHNNAGVEGEYARTAETTEENFDLTYGVNLKGVFLCMRAEIKQMMQQGGGSIVNTASIAGIEGARQLPAYVASKHAVLGLTRTSALEYAARGIRINAVCPGPIETPMLNKLMLANPRMEKSTMAAIPMRRLGQPEDIAEAVVWLNSDRAAFVCGHALVVDGAMTAGT